QCSSLSSLSLHDALPILSGFAGVNHERAAEVEGQINFRGRDDQKMIEGNFGDEVEIVKHFGTHAVDCYGLVHCGDGVGKLTVAKDRKSTRLNSSHVSISY